MEGLDEAGDGAAAGGDDGAEPRAGHQTGIVESRAQGAARLHGLGEHLGRATAVMGEQPVEEPPQGGAALDIVGGHLHREVALGVVAEGAVVEVGRADPEQALVDDRHLGMDQDGPALLRVRRHDPQATVAVGPAQARDQAAASAVHGQAVEAARAALGEHDHDLRPLGLPEPVGQRPRHDGRGQVLVLQIDEALRPADRGEGERGALGDGRAPGQRRIGARDRHRRVGEVRREGFGPGIMFRIGDRGAVRGDALAGGAAPALAGELGERSGGGAVDQHHHVVAGRVVLARG